MEDILKGAYDMHIHTSPDVSPRKSTDIEIAEEWKTAGMKGGVVKNATSLTRLVVLPFFLRYTQTLKFTVVLS